MGNAGSAHAQASLQCVARLSGADVLPPGAPEWQQLFSYATPLSRFDPDEVEREIRPHCAELGADGRGAVGGPVARMRSSLPPRRQNAAARANTP